MDRIIGELPEIPFERGMPDLDGMSAPETTDTPTLKLGLLTDPHYADIDELEGTRRPRMSLDKLRRAVEYFKSEGVNMIIALGDMINTSGDSARDEAALREITAPLVESGILTYCIWGNHDTEAMSDTALTANCGLLSAPMAVSIFGAKLILLDLCYKRDGSKYTPHENDWKNSAMPRDELDWLKAQLRITDGDVYVFSHQPLASTADDESADDYIASNSAEIRALLEKYDNVRAVYSGHRHCGGYTVINGIEYITLKGMCESSNVDLPDICKIIEFDVNGSRIDR